MSVFKRMQPMLGTYVEIGSDDGDEGKISVAVDAAFATIKLLHNLLSFHDPNSDLSGLNQSNGEPLAVHSHTLRVIKLARAMTVASKGLFNCTVGGAMVQQRVLPDHGGHNVPLAGDASDIVIKGNTVEFRRSIKVTLDGIAKGYAVDCAISTLKRFGLKSAWVNAGGDLRVYGDKVLPVCRRELNGESLALGGIQNAAVASSVVTHQYDKAMPGKIVSNTTAPQVGVWTVMAHSAWRADALTKVTSLLSASSRDQVITALGGVVVYPKKQLT
jgi:FAD:protein FMN transferase